MVEYLFAIYIFKNILLTHIFLIFQQIFLKTTLFNRMLFIN